MTIINDFYPPNIFSPSVEDTKEYIYAYEVSFRCSSDNFLSQERRRVGDMVIVHCDRGYNIGFVSRELEAYELLSLSNAHYKPKKILSELPSKDDKISDMLIAKIKAENEALNECRAHCEGRRIGALSDVLGAEFQFDRKKLTIFMKLYENVSVCRLVRKLYDTFKMRVKVLEVDSADVMEERAKRYLELSNLNVPLTDLFDRSTLVPNKPFPVELSPQQSTVPPAPQLDKPKHQQQQQQNMNQKKKKNSPQSSPSMYSLSHGSYLQHQYAPYQPQHQSRHPQDHQDYPPRYHQYSYQSHHSSQSYNPPHSYAPTQVPRRTYQPEYPTTYPVYRAPSPNAILPPPVFAQRTQRHSMYQLDDSTNEDSSTHSYASSPDSYYNDFTRDFDQGFHLPARQQALPATTHIAAPLPIYRYEEDKKSYYDQCLSDFTTPSSGSSECDLEDDIQSLIASLTLPKSTDRFTHNTTQRFYY